ncbi:protein of unknown function [Kyrpidia spormannii]|uniref:Uncharacterized protein n=2 Tax=Kyrpidia spormannii TaxID=2055160 RepID=A0ACA8Z9V4_9BACL|nr:protein of unknown function [Kyrpidia spormannii]CAB3393640.1 protein of unknown function [Kyrpidia spormannii]
MWSRSLKGPARTSMASIIITAITMTMAGVIANTEREGDGALLPHGGGRAFFIGCRGAPKLV